MRYARLRRPMPGLDDRVTYRVLRDDDVAGYVWIAAEGIGDSFVNPGRRCVWAAHLEVWGDGHSS